MVKIELILILSLLWVLPYTNNFYKEAFTQVNGGDNSLTENIVVFPESDGVIL